MSDSTPSSGAWRVPTESTSEILEKSGFEMLTKIKSGGMGEVLLCRRCGAHGFEKLVALKTIRTDRVGREDITVLFLDEARLLARLDHPVIAQVYDFFETDGLLFLVMEYVPGIPLNYLLKKKLRMPPSVAARLIAEVCRGLHAAHEMTDVSGAKLGVIHRDISPHNIMISFDGRVKILDFGIAKMRNRQAPHTQVGSLRGKLSYMAPEQLKREKIDRRVDLYTSSIVLYELLTNTKLWRPGSPEEAFLRAKRQDPIGPPSEIAGPLPGGLDEIVLRGLAWSPEERYPNARTMAEELDRVVAQTGGESLESFVERALDEEKLRHRALLQSLLDGATPPNLELEDPIDAAETVSVPASSEIPAQAALTNPTVRSPRLVIAGGVGFLLAALITVGVGVYSTTKEVQVPALPTKQLKTPPPKEATEPVTPVEEPKAPIEQPTPPAKQEQKKKKKRRPPRKAKKKVEPVEPAAPDVKKETGRVSITAVPYAQIRIDGVAAGVTPLIEHSLPVGSHEIVLVRPDTGAVRYKRTVVILEGRLERIIIP